MSDHSEQKSTESLTVDSDPKADSGSVGALVLLVLPLIPFLGILGLAKALDVVINDIDIPDNDTASSNEVLDGTMDG